MSRFSPLLRRTAVIALPMLATTELTTADAREPLLCVHGVERPANLTVRAGPSPGSPAIGSFSAGACGVQLVGRCADGWCEMSLGSIAGWVDTRFIAVYEAPRANLAAPAPPPPATAPGRPAPPVEAEAARRPAVEEGSADSGECVARVERGDTLRIRTGPGVSHEEVGGIPPGSCGVERSGGCRGRWCRIVWRGQTGWVNTFYLD